MKTYTIKKTVTEEQINDLIETAMQGISYWADTAYVVGADYEGYTSEALTKGRYIKIHDTEEEKWYNLTLKKILKGLSETDDLDFEQYDMYDADAVVQRALFGEVVYG